MLRSLAVHRGRWPRAVQICSHFSRCGELSPAAAAAAAARDAAAAAAPVKGSTSWGHVATAQTSPCNTGARFYSACGSRSSSSAISSSSSCSCCSSRLQRVDKRGISHLFNKLPAESPVSVCADGEEARLASLLRMQRSLESQLVEALQFYGIPLQQQQQQQQPQQQREVQQQDAAGPRVGMLLPPSPLSVAALAAVAAVGAVAVPLPFADAAVAAETAAAAAAAAGGVAAAGGAAARPLAAAVEEAGGDAYSTKPITCGSSLLSSSSTLRLLQQQLAEARVQLLLVHAALAAAASFLCEQLGLHAAICGSGVPAATDLCLPHRSYSEQQQQQAVAAARLFVRQAPRYTRGLSIRTKWLPLRSRGGGALGPPRELKEALAAAAESSSSSSDQCSSSSSTKALTTWSVLVDGSPCWGLPRAVLISAAATQQQLQRNSQQLLQHFAAGDPAVVAAAAAAFARPKLLLAVLLPLLQQQAQLLLLTRQRAGRLPLPLQVALQQQPKDAAAEALEAETPEARAAAVWELLLQRMRQQQQQRQLTLVLDLGTAEALLAVKERPSGATTPAAAAASAAAGSVSAAGADLVAAARQGICCCCICTDEADFVSMRKWNVRDSSSSSSSSSPPARVASVVKGWQLLLSPAAVVQHALSLPEVGLVAVQQQRGLAAEGDDPKAVAAAAAAAEAEGCVVGQLVPGVSALAEEGRLLFSSSSSSSNYDGRQAATGEAFSGRKEVTCVPGPSPAFRSALVGTVDEASRQVRVVGCVYTAAEPLQQRPLQQRLQQWQWGLPRMERLIEGFVHKTPITGKEWGNYHAKKRHWKRIF
ncbi:hypothetical protein Esti_005337 [Eimeria stiedai]